MKALLIHIKFFPLKVVALLKLVPFLITELKKIKKAEVVFFFPFYHTGGAEKVHLNIVKAIENPNAYIFFTNKSESNHFKKQFETLANTYEVFEFLNRNLTIRKFFSKVVANHLNENNKLISVFGCNSMYYYDFLPLLSPSIKKVDLIHAFSKPDYGLEIYSLPCVPLLNTRVVINHKTADDFKELYAENKLTQYFNQVKIIPNGLIAMNTSFVEKPSDNFSVIYVGRWAKEKRPELFIEIAKKVKGIHSNIDFAMAGTDLDLNNDVIISAGIHNKGEITNEKVLNELYQKANIILITSYREGFPVVIMEAMSNGVVPISTNVGGICEHIVDGHNGFLIENDKDDTVIIEKFVQKIIELYQDNSTFNQVSSNAYMYAQKEFGIDNFNKNYKGLLLNKN
ncbi:glycosyltransferase [Flavobacterium amnicola]|uniref:Glycosyltransferase n=1 Tax=Flavobacterium amnicola TaxID=2506422 RepID=A0A4Q1K2B7_9FLAO|nr:glycosyltransferase family 4 protein [Flavobacterium amnicola]RXR17758.1 glycosyltransferase [Flavobacterium amnicola]